MICKTKVSQDHQNQNGHTLSQGSEHMRLKISKGDMKIGTKTFHNNHAGPHGLHLHGFWNGKTTKGSHQGK